MQNSFSVESIEIFKKQLDNLKKVLSKKPSPKQIKTNKYANNSKYLEIGYVEAELDRKFASWDWEIIQFQQIANGIVVSGKLTVITYQGLKIVRSGMAGVEIQTKSGSTELNPSTVSSKAMDRDPGRADAYALKNAAAKLGSAFGRNLNREWNYEHIPDENIINLIYQPLKKD